MKTIELSPVSSYPSYLPLCPSPYVPAIARLSIKPPDKRTKSQRTRNVEKKLPRTTWIILFMEVKPSSIYRK